MLRLQESNSEKSTAPGLVVKKILNQLKGGQLKPGDRLPSQRELAASLGVSRSTIREAINTLSGMGYLHAVHGKGTFIREEIPASTSINSQWNSFLEAGTIFDLMEAREFLECKAAALAAKRARRESLCRIREAVKKIAESGDDISRFFDADLDFHIAMAEASGNKVICEMIKALIKKVLKYHTYFRATSSARVRRLTLKTASQILTHLTSGKGRKASQSMHSHLSTVSNELKEIMQELAPVLAGLDKRLRKQ